MIGVVRIGRRHAGEHVLIGLSGEQVAVFQGLLAEVGQERVARAIHLDLAHQLEMGTPLGLHGQGARSKGSIRRIGPHRFTRAQHNRPESFELKTRCAVHI
jgi:hypothetical protein